MAADPYQIRLDDDPAIKSQARESTYGWAGDRAEISLWTKVKRQVESGGAFDIPSDGSTHAIVNNVTRAGTHRSAVIWRKVGDPLFVPGEVGTLVVSARLRMSVWAFTPPFAKSLVGTGPKATQKDKDVVLDADLLALLPQAGIDDLSLVHTIGWDQRDSGQSKPKPPRWKGFVPLGSADHREAYLRNLIDALHKIGVQVLVGFELVKPTIRRGQTLTDSEKTLKANAQDFADWLHNASASEIEDYAHSIYAFFATKGLDIDGIGFDFEFDELGDAQKDNLALLYQKTSDAMAHRNGIVSYANAPFLEDGAGSHGFMRVQPFSIAATELNLLARPMCFDAVNSTKVADIEASIACALRSPQDSKPGGAGLHPSQVQFGIWAAKVTGGLEKLCREVLRPNRIGLMIYNMPPDRTQAIAFLKNCALWNAALNPDEGPPGQPGLPLQVPRGFGGWPPPFVRPDA